MKKEGIIIGFVTGFFMLIYVGLIALALTGWIKGLVKFCECDFEPNYKAEIIYGVGVFTGLNCIVGYMDLGK